MEVIIIYNCDYYRAIYIRTLSYSIKDGFIILIIKLIFILLQLSPFLIPQSLLILEPLPPLSLLLDLASTCSIGIQSALALISIPFLIVESRATSRAPESFRSFRIGQQAFARTARSTSSISSVLVDLLERLASLARWYSYFWSKNLYYNIVSTRHYGYYNLHLVMGAR